MDTRLGYVSLPLEVDGAEIHQGRVAAGRIVEALDVVEHLGLGVTPRAVDFADDALRSFSSNRRRELNVRFVNCQKQPFIELITARQPCASLATVSRYSL